MNTRTLAVSALSIALLAISALIAIPLGSIPVTLQVAVVILIALIATPPQALISMGGYIALGALGLPIFSGGRGGLGIIAGPTGGFLWGFLLGAFVATLLGESNSTRIDIAKAAIVIAVMYLCGWIQLVLMTGMTPFQAFMTGIAPFVLLDVAKAAVAILVARPLRKALSHQATR